METLDIKLDNAEEVKFKLSYQGNLSEIQNEIPKIRFLIEDSTGNTIGFPAKKSDDGYVSAKIPPLEKHVSNNESYKGKLEIVIGNRYFNPITVKLNFIKEFDVKVESIVQKEIKAKEKQSSFTAITVKEKEKEIKEDTEDADQLIDLFETLEIKDESTFKQPVKTKTPITKTATGVPNRTKIVDTKKRIKLV